MTILLFQQIISVDPELLIFSNAHAEKQWSNFQLTAASNFKLKLNQ